MKILIVSQYFYPEAFRVNLLAKELVTRGHEVTVLTGYPQYPYGEIYSGYGFNIPYERDYYGVKIQRIPVHPRGHSALGMLRNCISFVIAGNRWVKQCTEKFDCVYVFEVSPVTVGLPAVKYKKKFNTRMLFNVQDLWPDNVIEVLGVKNKLVISVINRIVDKIYKHSDLILCSSKGFTESIASRGINKSKLKYWPQFCEAVNLNESDKPSIYDSNYFNVVFTGNIGYAQGLNLLIEAAEMLKGKPVRFYLVGDGRAKDELSVLVKAKKLNDSVIFVGKVSEYEANCYVKFSDCAYLSFSDSTLFDLTIPAKLQTYLACGAVVLGAVGGESADIINRAECGFVCRKTSADVSEKILTLMNSQQSLIRQFRSNSLKYFNQNFQMDKLIGEFEAYLR